MFLIPLQNIVDAHANKSGAIDLFKPHTPGFIDQKDAKDEQDTLVAKHNPWTQLTNHRWKLITESGIMNTDHVVRVCPLESFVISTAPIINPGFNFSSGYKENLSLKRQKTREFSLH